MVEEIREQNFFGIVNVMIVQDTETRLLYLNRVSNSEKKDFCSASEDGGLQLQRSGTTESER